MQCDPRFRDEMTYTSPSTGDRVGLSFIHPRTREELEARRVMMLNWARTTCGMMGRSPDFMNVTLAAWAAAADYFGRDRPEFAQNIRRYYEFIRENDIVLTHSLINLQRSRNASGMFNLQEGTALRVDQEKPTADLVVRGARVLATLGPIADEIAVYSPRLGQHSEDSQPVRRRLAIPCGAQRPALPLPRQLRPRPLAFRPSARLALRGDGLHRVLRRCTRCPGTVCSCSGDVALLNGAAYGTHYSAHSSHQGAAKNLAKCEFVLGIALLMTETLGNKHLPHTESLIGELMLTTTLTRALIRAAEADAKLDEWGVMCPDSVTIESTRNLFMTAYPRMIEILQLLGSSSFMLTPSEADFNGPLAGHIEQYLTTDTTSARDRVKLFRLAWDVAGSSFGSRQVLYERFFASDPLTRARALAAIYPKNEAMQRVLDFLQRDDTP